jgi:lysine 2,3-aminomutase
MKTTDLFENEGLKSDGFAENRSFADADRTKAFRERFFPDVAIADWNDWRWQLKHCISDVRTLSRFVDLSEDEREMPGDHSWNMPLRIPPYYLSLLNPHDSALSLRRTVIPSMEESRLSSGESEDPLSEDNHSPVPELIHRYPDRVVFLVTTTCATFCRYCMRSRIVGRGSRPRNNSTRWLAALVYIQEHPEVRDVLISGGDPLILEDDALDFIIRQLRRIPHVEMIRIGTKMPMSLPQRITTSLTSMLKKYHPLWMSLHVTHPDELTPECRTACSRLADAGIPLGSQTVLLKGVNDSLPTLKALMHGLIRFRVKPYYLFQCDPIPGTSHFRTPVSKGLEMIQGLQGHTSGYAVPTFAVDAPGGGGKIPLLPEYLVGRDENGLILRNYEGKIFCYPDKGVLTG